MAIVRMVQCWSGCYKKERMEEFYGIKGLGDWIFNQMGADYSSKDGV